MTHLTPLIARSDATGKLATRLALALAVTFGALALIPATGIAAVKFGAKLTGDVQPSNSTPAHECEPTPGQKCTRVSMEAYGRPDGGERAPKSGVIRKLRLIAGEPGSFRLQIAKANPATQRAKIVRKGPRIAHGSSVPVDPAAPYEVQRFKVKVAVKKGQYLAIKTKQTSVLRCSSGGPNQLLFQPPLSLRGPFETADATDGCWLLLEAVVR